MDFTHSGERPKSSSGCSILVSRRIFLSNILVIVNVTALFLNLSRQVEASSLGGGPPPPPPIRSSPAELRSQIRAQTEPNVDSAHHHHHHHHHQQQQSQPQQQQQQQHMKLIDTVPRANDTSPADSKHHQQLANSLETSALNYLQKYGYMNAHSNVEANNLISEDSFSDAISSFQRFAGIPETGIVDEQTVQYMQMPRCGNVDRPHTPSDPGGGGGGVGAERSATIRKRGILGSVRRKRYALQGSKWRRQELTYRISQYPTRFNGKRHEVDAQIEKAFGIWSQVAPINFVVKKEGRVHIDIRFASGDHGDGDAFDGPGNTLAHAYFPQYGGDAHFDDQEYWTIDSYAGTNIFQVAAHELGHSLGLGHSNVREALMAPFYQKYKPHFKLHIDDVLAIQALYGEKAFLPPEVPHTSGQQPAITTTTSVQQPAITSTTSTSPRPTTTSPTTVRSSGRGVKPSFSGQPQTTTKQPETRETSDDENSIPDLGAGHPARGPGGPSVGGVTPDDTSLGAGGGGGALPSSSVYPADLCSDPTIDAITRTDDGSSYVFKGDFYWLLTNEGLAKGYPRRISADWDGLPGSLDAALTWADGKTFFFKGNKYWRFRNRRPDIGYPKLISAGFAGIPDDIDAAFVWSGNGRTYIFKGAEYWRFDSKADPPVSSEYPRSIKVWSGVPSHINAAFRWENNVTYFFKGGQYYRFNDKEFKVESRGRPPFPRLSSEWWFGCISSNLAQRALPGNLTSPEARVGLAAGAGAEDIDWSFFASMEGRPRIMGTHISDHKPQGSFVGEAAGDNTADKTGETSSPPLLSSSSSSGTTIQVRRPRIGPNQHPATVSSSAISSARVAHASGNYLVLAWSAALLILGRSLTTTTTTIITMSHRRGHW